MWKWKSEREQHECRWEKWREKIYSVCQNDWSYRHGSSANCMKMNQRTSLRSRMGLPLIFVETFITGWTTFFRIYRLDSVIVGIYFLPVASTVPKPNPLWPLPSGLHEGLLPAGISHLQSRITTTVETITPGILMKVWQESNYRLDVCNVINIISSPILPNLSIRSEPFIRRYWSGMDK
jgi:hypothetical protein